MESKKPERQTKHETHRDTENRLVVVRGEGGVGEMGELFLFILSDKSQAWINT